MLENVTYFFNLLQFCYICGIHPNTELFKGLVECDEKGYIAAGEDGVTTAPGIFAAGDVRTKPLRQIVTAVADGANAVAGVQDYFLQDSF